LTEAVQWLEKAAAQGSPTAQFELAAMYAQGLGVAQDHAEAIRRYRELARQGHSAARRRLVELFAAGLGDSTPEDLLEQYRALAERGEAHAQFEFANRLYNGEGVGRDVTESAKWYRRAAEQGLAAAHMSSESARGRRWSPEG